MHSSVKFLTGNALNSTARICYPVSPNNKLNALAYTMEFLKIVKASLFITRLLIIIYLYILTFKIYSNKIFTWEWRIITGSYAIYKFDPMNHP